MKLPSFTTALCLGVILTSSLATQAQLTKAPSPNLAPSAKIAGPSDAEILHIFVTTNSIAVDSAGIGQSRSKNKDVISFAKAIESEVGALNSEVTALAKKTGTRPTSGLTSQGLMNQARQEVSKLKSLEGKAFDQTYVSTAITALEKAAGHLEDNLLLNIKDGEVKNLLTKARKVYGGLVARGKKLQADMPK